jgi:AGZA family xanthine/uracil permease-like MFS transporter
MIERIFRLSDHDTTIPREILAGTTTFLTMSYILVVQPNVLSQDFSGNPTGLEPGAVLLATCVASALATAAMGLYAGLPVALAPGMGQNFFFVSVIMAMGAGQFPGEPWQAALGIVFVSGVLFVGLTVLGIRDVVLDVMSPSMRSAIVVGIGLFIAFIGLQNANIVIAAPGLVALNVKELLSVDSAVFWTGFTTILVLKMRRVPGSMLIGISVAAITAWGCGQISIDRVFGWPEFTQRAALQLDFRAAFTFSGLSYVAVFLFMDIFDTTGTLIGVSQQAGLMKDGRVPRMREAMLADSVGTVAGACVGTSTVTSYIESVAGVEQGGRTGLTAFTTAILFVLAIGFSPLIVSLGKYAPVTAPALVVVGAMMFRAVRSIDWPDETEAIPAFLLILAIPIFFSIADGMALGLIVWPLLKIACGRTAEVPRASLVIAVIVIVYFAVIRVHI